MSERLTDEERSDWEQYRKYLLMIWRRSETVVDTKGLCALIESEKTGWAEADKWRTEAFKQNPTQDAYDAACSALWTHREDNEKLREEVERLKGQLQDALNTLQSIRPVLGCEMWGVTLKKANEAVDGCIQRIQEGKQS